MNNFLEDNFNEKIISIINIDENGEILSSFLDTIFIIEKEISKTPNLDNKSDNLLKFDNLDQLKIIYSLDYMREKLILRIIFFRKLINHFIFTHNNSSNKKFNLIISLQFFIKKFVNGFIQEFHDYHYILFSFKEYKLLFKKILKILFENFKDLELINTFYSQILSENNLKEIQKNILILIYINFLSKIKNNFCIINILCKYNCDNSINFLQFDNLVNYIFDSFRYLKNILNSQSESIINKINNEIITLFKETWFNLINQKFYKNLESFFEIDEYLNRIVNEKIHLITENFEIYIFIYEFYFKNIIDKNVNLSEMKISDNINANYSGNFKKLKILKNILENNNPSLHRFALDFLKNIFLKIENNKIKVFVEKFIILYDVLDGFNSHLFKQMVKELVFIIEFCEKDGSDIVYDKNTELFILENPNKKLKFLDIFLIPHNYFYILSNKIFSHENSRIQKFFIKTFSQISKEKSLKNKNFENFLYITFMKSINNPLFYPENENIGYHTKLGFVVENLFTSWLLNILYTETKFRFLQNFERFLYGIANFIELKRILIYLMNVIRNIFYENFYLKRKDDITKNSNFHLKINNLKVLIMDEEKDLKENLEYENPDLFFNILININTILSKNFKNLSIYTKNNFWENICLIFFEIDLLPFKEICLKNLRNQDKYSKRLKMEIEFYKFIEFFLDYFIFRGNSLSSLISSDKDFIFNINNKKYCENIFDKNSIFKKFFTFILNNIHNDPDQFPIPHDLFQNYINKNNNISYEILEKYVEIILEKKEYENVNITISNLEKIILLFGIKQDFSNSFVVNISLGDFLFSNFNNLLFSSYIEEKEKDFITKILSKYLDILNFSFFKDSENFQEKLINIIEKVICNLNIIKSSCFLNLFENKNNTLCNSFDQENNYKSIFNFDSFISNTENLFINSNSIENKYILKNFKIIEKIIAKSLEIIFNRIKINDLNIIKYLYDLFYKFSLIDFSKDILENDFFLKKILYLNSIFENNNENPYKIYNLILINLEFLSKYFSLLETINFIFWKRIFKLKKNKDTHEYYLRDFLIYTISQENYSIYLSKINKQLYSFYNIIEDFLIKNEKKLTIKKLKNENDNCFGDYSGKNIENEKVNQNIDIYTTIRSSLIKIKYFLCSTLNIKTYLKNIFIDSSKNTFTDNLFMNFIKNIYHFDFKKNFEENQIIDFYSQDYNFNKGTNSNEELILKQYSDNLSIDYLIKNYNKEKRCEQIRQEKLNYPNVKLNFSFNSNYMDNLFEYLEKCSEDIISYIFDLISFEINTILNNSIYNEIDIENQIIPNLKNLQKIGINLLVNNKENLNYINVKSFIKMFMKKEFFESYNFKLIIINDLISTITKLNEKRTWLLIKVLVEEFIHLIINENLSLKILKGLETNLMDLSEAKETRGDDSFMLNSIPNFLYSPFNLKKIRKKFINYNNINSEDISKYGIYVRWSISKLFENLLISFSDKFANINIESFQIILEDIEFLLGFLYKIISLIEKNSSSKSEMQFTTKHRKKLRLSQFLVIISKIFLIIECKLNSNEWRRIMENISNDEEKEKCNKILNSCNEIVESILIINCRLFEKINLYSVKFYLELFSLNFTFSSEKFLNYLINIFKNPESKTHCVSSSMIVLSMLFLKTIKDTKYSKITETYFINFFEILISLCTSNVCNIRGFAQFFVYKFSEIFKDNKILMNYDSSINFSNVFINYLTNNNNIQRFFKKFDESFLKFVDIYSDYNFENIISKNFDEINCEIIPIDIINEFKVLGMKMIKLENEDLTKPNISWKWGLCPELMDSILKSEKLGTKKTKKLNLESFEIIKEILDSENKILKQNIKSNNIFQEKIIKKEPDSSIAQLDFQKKYRPDDNFIDSNEFTNDEADSIKNGKKRNRFDIVVMASFIDKAPNLGGLARTCEVFNFGCMTICSEAFLNDNAFLTAAASAEKWLPLINLPSCDVEIFLISYKKLGYKIIGLEQTANSITLKDFKFTEKIVIVLGNEKEGIPQNVINLIDYCVIIPQFGQIRSLNVHVSAALMFWEIVNSINK